LVHLLLAANVVLLVALAYLVGARQATVLPPPAAPAPAQPEPTASSAPLVVTNVVADPFHWRQLESEDYRAYITRLRSIGCPEQTIRDLIISDLDTLMAPRVQATYARREHLGYWHSEEEELANDADPHGRGDLERVVDKEKRDIVKELLGIDLVRERLRQKGQTDFYERRLGFLSEDKRDQVRRLLEEFDEKAQALRRKEELGEVLNATDRELLLRNEQARHASVAALLSPAELAQYELWMSPTANAVRHDLFGMDATEEEFLSVYRLRRQFDELWTGQDLELLDKHQRAVYDEGRKELEMNIRQQLGDERYAQYERGQDESFHALRATAARFKLDKTKAAEVYELKQTWEGMRDSVFADTNLNAAQKESALQAMRQETELAVKEKLGDQAYRYYQRTGHASWVQHVPALADEAAASSSPPKARIADGSALTEP
jgi:hypothetical protein